MSLRLSGYPGKTLPPADRSRTPPSSIEMLWLSIRYLYSITLGEVVKSLTKLFFRCSAAFVAHRPPGIGWEDEGVEETLHCCSGPPAPRLFHRALPHARIHGQPPLSQ